MGNKFWLDDPEWELLQRRTANKPISKRLRQQARPGMQQRDPRELARVRQTQRSSGDKEVTVNLKLTVPKIKLPDFGKQLRRHRKKLLVSAGVLLVMASGAGGFRVWRGRATPAAQGGPATAIEQAQAEFNPLTPLASAKPDFKYDPDKKVLGYVTDFEGTSMTISQQELPEDIKSGKTNVLTIAQSIKAVKSIDTQNGTTYLATDEKTKAQTAVFSANDVLVFVRSSKTLDDEDWRRYINQLNPSK